MDAKTVTKWDGGPPMRAVVMKLRSSRNKKGRGWSGSVQGAKADAQSLRPWF